MAQNQLKEDLILNTGQFDSKIDGVIKKVHQLEAQGKNVGNGFTTSLNNMINRATGFNLQLDKMTGSMGSLKAGAGLLAIGVALKKGYDIAKEFTDQGVQVAREAEGIRIAFAKLNDPNMLDGLREATHNAVTDVELMKAAVKFNDFNLPLDQLGTFLAYAQQKAKDTGESIDYMVDSIVTGLGRKSLPILDNLGLSSVEIKNKMKEVGDMTTAVAEIIKEKMEAAGGYVETASERVQKQEVALQNKLDDLGRTYNGLYETVEGFWTDMKMGVIDLLIPLGNALSYLTELGRIMGIYNKMGGEKKIDTQIAMLSPSDEKKARATLKKQNDAYKKYIDERKQYVKNYNKWNEGQKKGIVEVEAYDRMKAYQKKHGVKLVNEVKEEIKAAEKMQQEYNIRANAKLAKFKYKPTVEDTNTGNTKTSTKNLAIYRAEATTIAEITENIKYLEEAQKKAEPNTKKYREISDELEEWRRRLQYVNFDKFATSFNGISKNIQILRNQLNRLDPNSKEFKEVNQQLKVEEDKLKNIQRIIDDLEFDENANTIDGINKNLAVMQNKLNGLVIGSREYLEVQKKIKELQGKRDELVSDAEVGSIAYYRKELAELIKELENKNLTDEKRKELAEYRVVLEDYIATMEKASNMSLWTKGQFTGQTRIAIEQFQNYKASLQDIKEVYEDGLINEADFRKGLATISESMKKFGFPPIEVEVIPRWKLDFDKDFGKFKSNADSIFGAFEGFDGIVNSFESLSDAISEGANAWEIFMGVLRSGMSIIDAVGSTMDAVATIQSLFAAKSTATAVAKTAEGAAAVQAAGEEASTIPVKGAEMAANKALETSVLDLAAAQIFLAHSPIPLVGVGLAGSQIATMMAAMAAQHAASLSLAAYANGGIVGGNSYAGDNLIARVNSGEMILTTFQQKKLFDLLDNGGTITGGAANVNFVIKGKDLHGVLANYNDKAKKII